MAGLVAVIPKHCADNKAHTYPPCVSDDFNLRGMTVSHLEVYSQSQPAGTRLDNGAVD